MPLPSNLKITRAPKNPTVLTVETFKDLVKEAASGELSVEVKITPKLAAWLMAERNPQNRPINEVHVASLARDMKNGKWYGHVGDEMTIDRSGNINNVQHRLRGIIESGTTQTMVVRFGMSAKARLPEGTGRNKTYSNYLAMIGGKDAKHLENRASAIRLLHGFLHDQNRPKNKSGNFKPTQSELNEIDEQFGAELYDSLKFVMSNNITLVTVATNASVLHFLMKQTAHADKADEFFEKLGTGVGLTSNNPILIARNRFLADSNSNKLLRHQSNKDAAMGLIAKAWNAWVSGKTWTNRERNPSEFVQMKGLDTVGKYKVYDTFGKVQQSLI